MAALTRAPSIRVIAGEVQSRTATNRLVIPSVGLNAWLPFVRVGETIASRARQFPPHTHEHEEVLTYLSEGSATYRLGERPGETASAGTAFLLSSASNVTHSISPIKGGSVRWFVLVIALRAELSEPRLQSSHLSEASTFEEKTQVRRLVGPRAPMTSHTGLECRELVFVQRSTSFLRVGHDRHAVVYAMSGAGTVDGRGLQAGEGALISDVSGIAIAGTPGLRVIAATAPAPIVER